MGVLGGTLGYRVLKTLCADGVTYSADVTAYANKSKLATLLGETLLQEIRDKVVVDFGCGSGAEVVEIAHRGARKVIGIDMQESLLWQAKQRASQCGVDDRCTFVTTSPPERADIIVSLDAFEHFEDPASILEAMHDMLKPAGWVIASFGPTWYHPYGGHLFSVFPWAHLIFTERSLIRWRSDFKSDGATRFEEIAGGLNKMTIARFERIVAESPFQCVLFEPVTIRRLRGVAPRLTREFTTSVVRCKLVRPAESSMDIAPDQRSSCAQAHRPTASA